MKKTYFDDQFLSCSNDDLVIPNKIYKDAISYYEKYKLSDTLIYRLEVFVLPLSVVLFASCFHDWLTPAMLIATILPFLAAGISRCSLLNFILGIGLFVAGLVKYFVFNVSSNLIFDIPIGFAAASLYFYIVSNLYVSIALNPVKLFSPYRLGDFNRSFDEAPEKIRDHISAQLQSFPKAVDAISAIDKQFRPITNLELKKLQIEFLGGEESSVSVVAYQEKEATRLDKCKRCSVYEKCPIKPGGKLESMYKAN